MEKESSSRQGVQVIARAAAILRVLENQPDGLSLGAIAKALGLARSTVQRIVYALDEERFVIAASPTGRVRLGPGLVSLGSAAKADIDRVILPYMKQLSDEIEETVDLSVHDGSSMIFIDQIITEKQRLMAVSAVGQPFPIHSCANGKAVLAAMNDDEINKLLIYPLERSTNKTLIEENELQEDIKKIRKTGVAFDLEEHHQGLCAVGACISGPYGQNLALSIPVPSVRFYGNEDKLAKTLLKYCDIIEVALGKVS
ncbi:MAG: IclR family transcriptional regulator [Marinomonas sp.]|uniref:IclR family transcriptional regulator n=1 Tax=unclassified Marinomonas TaxID=196814 RepID=UPI0007AF7C8D|nr:MULTISPECIES: IclR family transcriptional regulator [unclassified Marinomonas]KZM42529.1 IclR family transcriptional regulator [Marinomonas sp. SBI22]KZM43923.1 IclR family transcriptional regulator [Marinomonas sp. SBI8L]